MIKKCLMTAAGLVVMMLVLLAGCSSPEKNENPVVREKNYQEIMSEKLVSFTDCANAFCDCLDKIALKDSAPSDTLIGELSGRLDRLESVCAAMKDVKAPAGFSSAQAAMNKAMEEYAGAFEKGRALLDFYRGYDRRFHDYKNPEAGRAEIEKEERALYGEFAAAMARASASFREACREFDKAA